jgi:hypothetical protein
MRIRGASTPQAGRTASRPAHIYIVWKIASLDEIGSETWKLLVCILSWIVKLPSSPYTKLQRRREALDHCIQPCTVHEFFLFNLVSFNDYSAHQLFYLDLLIHMITCLSGIAYFLWSIDLEKIKGSPRSFGRKLHTWLLRYVRRRPRAARHSTTLSTASTMFATARASPTCCTQGLGTLPTTPLAGRPSSPSTTLGDLARSRQRHSSVARARHPPRSGTRRAPDSAARRGIPQFRRQRHRRD